MNFEECIRGESYQQSMYVEKTFSGTQEEYLRALGESSTIYVTNVRPGTRETRLWHLFSICGPVRRVIFGVNRNRLTPADFLFVEYGRAEDAERAIKFFRGLEFSGLLLAVDKDVGFQEGRQYGRGVYGGKYRDDYTRKRRYSQYRGGQQAH